MSEKPHEKPLQAFGDPDDHLRLTVEIARRLRAPEGHEVLQPRIAWRDRRDALDALLHEAPRDRPTLDLIDVDALAARNERHEPWDDWDFSGHRRQLLESILRSAEHGCWRFLRPEPTADVSSRLPIEDASSPGDAGDEATEWSQLAPVLRPLATGLLERGCMSRERLDATLDSAEEQDALILSLSYDTLPADCRRAAMQLAVPRGVQALNGYAGPYVWGQQVSRAQVSALRQAGWLGPDERRFHMARSARRFLLLRAGLEDREQLRKVHALVATQADDELERHHHALGAGDASLAIETATHYGADLRLLARELSVERQEYAEAARLYRKVVESFDPSDAYAWEYLAFNLERAHDGADSTAPQIVDAYLEACKLEPNNPLYRGRWLAFRARRGEKVATDVNRYVKYFAGPGSHREAVSFLCERVLRRLQEQDRHDELREITRRSGRVLAKADRLRPLLAE